jgi:hypothetical protein
MPARRGYCIASSYVRGHGDVILPTTGTAIGSSLVNSQLIPIITQHPSGPLSVCVPNYGQYNPAYVQALLGTSATMTAECINNIDSTTNVQLVTQQLQVWLILLADMFYIRGSKLLLTDF